VIDYIPPARDVLIGEDLASYSEYGVKSEKDYDIIF
jgi:hypothetical protein